MSERLKEINKLGQSIWYDNIQRSMIASGKLDKLIASGVTGMTSNPSIFEKSITGSTDYDSSINELTSIDLNLDLVYEKLVLEDIASAADILRKVYDSTGGLDGYVSLEVRPTLAMDADNTVLEARGLFSRLERPNIMIKVPATPESVPAIKTLIAEGININVTLIFSLEQYESAAEAYLAGLEERLASGKDISHVASVASFFVSRVDTAVDKDLTKIGNTSLQGKIGIANSKIAYRRFHQLFSGERWESLAAAGARVQRPLWASTSTKNPAYPDTLYVDNLIGSNTVNTVPPHTLEAFIDHGKVESTLEKDVDQANLQIKELEALGVDLDQITLNLQQEGVAAFKQSFLSLMDNLSKKVNQLRNRGRNFSTSLGDYHDRIEKAVQEVDEQKVIKGIYEHDYTIWKNEATEITNRLGWLDIAQRMKPSLAELEMFVSEINQAGFTSVQLLGMGGSSLAPEVFREIFGVRDGYLDLAVLDTTDPDAIYARAASLDLAKTLFIVSTKSGGTVETISLFKYFYNQVATRLDGEGAGSHFIAITDAGSQLDQISTDFKFRRVFHNDPNIGGRFSALSYFGLVPAALIGVDLEKLLASTETMDKNQAALLGTAIAELAKDDRDKLTLLISPKLASFGIWVEQLIAESTGKDGHGILPVVGEPVSKASDYGDDRTFVQLKLSGETDYDDLLAELERRGNPLMRLQVDNIYEIGGQMLLWELATAVAGTRLKINPFDQPNVESAKVLAREMVSVYLERGELPQSASARVLDGIMVYPDQEPVWDGIESTRQVLNQFLADAGPGAYIALQAYLQPTAEAEQLLQILRAQLRDATKLATTLGYGPRFLHSTGQLHKGDAGQGMFIQLTKKADHNLPIPDQAGSDISGIDFGVLIQTQALGDRQALLESGRRVLRLDLGQEPIRNLQLLISGTG
jgi:transaldolase/glucose-6-phosphate isomerase